MSTGTGQVRAHADEVEAVGRAIRALSRQEAELVSEVRYTLLKNTLHKASTISAERSRSLKNAQAVTAQAKRALAQCQENCGGLVSAVNAAQRREREAEASLDRARKAVILVQQAQQAVGEVFSRQHPRILDHAQSAVAACADLAGRLRGIVSLGGLLGRRKWRSLSARRPDR